jgi:hypothetical protein
MAFYPIPFGHAEVRVDKRPARSARRGCLQPGPVEGVWGNREVPPEDASERKR